MAGPWQILGAIRARDPRSSDNLRGSFFQKKKRKMAHKISRSCVTSGHRNSTVITDRRKFTAKLSLYGMSSFHFYRKNQFKVFYLRSTFCTRKVFTHIFGNVRCPILRVKTNSTPQCWCGLASDICKKSRLNWKLKISNMAYNVGMSQSQARDTRYRRMQ